MIDQYIFPHLIFSVCALSRFSLSTTLGRCTLCNSFVDHSHLTNSKTMRKRIMTRLFPNPKWCPDHTPKGGLDERTKLVFESRKSRMTTTPRIHLLLIISCLLGKCTVRHLYMCIINSENIYISVCLTGCLIYVFVCAYIKQYQYIQGYTRIINSKMVVQNKPQVNQIPIQNWNHNHRTL